MIKKLAIHIFICITSLFVQPMDSNQIKNQKYKHLSSLNEEYNQQLPLIRLIPEIKNQIFFHCLAPIIIHGYIKSFGDEVECLETNIATFMRLKHTCKYFNTLLDLQTIGSLCRHHDTMSKEMILLKISKRMEWNNNYETHKQHALLLLYAGANARVDNNILLKIAVKKDNTQFADLLLKHNADPYAYLNNEPLHFQLKSTAMAQVFIDNKVDMNDGHSLYPNVLWYILPEKYLPELMQFYLNNNIDPTLLDYNKSCLLHHLVGAMGTTRNADDYLKKAKLLLAAIPEMINTKNQYAYTPIDCIHHRIESHKEQVDLVGTYNREQVALCKQLLTLFKKASGVTSKELYQSQQKHEQSQQKQARQKRDHCVIS